MDDWTVLICHKELSEEMLYKITKQKLNNEKNLKAKHQLFKDLTPHNIQDGTLTPLHPGAAKYYREVGIIK